MYTSTAVYSTMYTLLYNVIQMLCKLFIDVVILKLCNN